MADIKGKESPEMYLKAIYLTIKEKNYCRQIDVANYLGLSRPSVSVGISKLKKEGYLNINENGMIILTNEGMDRAQMVYDKFCFWKAVFEKYGLDSKTAETEACKVEHALSDEAFLQIKKAIQTRND